MTGSILIKTNELRYALDRYRFEYMRDISNICFMLNEHLSDGDDSYVVSDEFTNLMENLNDHFIYMQSSSMMVAHELVVSSVDDYFVFDFYFNDADNELFYRVIY